ncbi:MAG TPA: ATP-binding SpoIIE family protein phosphatase [Candidatus Binatia bacterium]|nr:ATP-binding SpoIIE family protein phosphatase [Candidatus Binatia bacterium]
MEVTAQLRLPVADTSHVGAARRCAADLGRSLGFGETDTGRVALVVTEAATNLVRHAGGGELLLQGLEHDGARGLRIMALDRGPGLTSVAEAMRDGFSQGGTPGTGLGAIRRLSSEFDLYSSPGGGVALAAAIWPAPRADDSWGLRVGGVNVPYPGEDVSGDDWDLNAGPGRLALLVSDGLGHGAAAAAASALARETFRRHAAQAPGAVLQRIHAALRATRGAAAAIAEIDRARATVRFAGVGNIAASIVAGGTSRSLVSHHGTLGHDVRRIQEFTYEWPAGALLVLHSDGLVSHWTLDRYPGLAARHPWLVAGVLYRDFRRGRDDISVVVTGEAP